MSRKPSMTICPESVAVTVEFSPQQRSAMANSVMNTAPASPANSLRSARWKITWENYAVSCDTFAMEFSIKALSPEKAKVGCAVLGVYRSAAFDTDRTSFFSSVMNFALSVRGFAMNTQFTLIPELRDWMISYACFSTAMFGAAYFIVPRLAGVAWHSSALVKAHYYCTVAGILLLTVGLGYAGWQQGHLLNNTTVPFSEITAALKPWLGPGRGAPRPGR